MPSVTKTYEPHVNCQEEIEHTTNNTRFSRNDSRVIASQFLHLSVLIFVMLAVYSFAVSDVQAKKKAKKQCTKPAKDNEDWESSDYTNVIETSLKRFLSDYKDDELKEEMQRLLEIADAKKPGEKEETDEPGWETETESEREIIVGTVKRGEKIKRGQSDWEITDEDERELFVRGSAIINLLILAYNSTSKGKSESYQKVYPGTSTRWNDSR
ncbi:unnamed protein product [Trichobilharzia regenti]|nr:unnamed protein product [Trichobilharzia regenti]